MSVYQTPADMFSARAARFQRDGNRHWAMAKSGEGDFHYGKARFCYEQSRVNAAKAAHAAATGAKFR